MNHHLFKTRGQIQPFTLLFLSSMVANSLARIGREISEKIWNLDLPMRQVMSAKGTLLAPNPSTKQKFTPSKYQCYYLPSSRDRAPSEATTGL